MFHAGNMIKWLRHVFGEPAVSFESIGARDLLRSGDFVKELLGIHEIESWDFPYGDLSAVPIRLWEGRKIIVGVSILAMGLLFPAANGHTQSGSVDLSFNPPLMYLAHVGAIAAQTN